MMWLSKRMKASRSQRVCSTRYCWRPALSMSSSRSSPELRSYAARRGGCSRSSSGGGTCGLRGMSAAAPRRAASTRVAGRRSRADTGRAGPAPSPGRTTTTTADPRSDTSARSCRRRRRRSAKTAASRGRTSGPPTSSRRTTRRRSSSRNGPAVHGRHIEFFRRHRFPVLL